MGIRCKYMSNVIASLRFLIIQKEDKEARGKLSDYEEGYLNGLTKAKEIINHFCAGEDDDKVQRMPEDIWTG